jgi:zinc-ribbon domain
MDRYCRNCGHELRPDDRFCPNCGQPVHETAVVPTAEADVPVPLLPQQSEETIPLAEEQAEPLSASRPNNIVEAFRQLSATVQVTLAAAALVGVIAVANQSGSAVLLTAILLIVAFIAYVRPEEGAGPNSTLVGTVSAEPISKPERSRLLDDAIGGYLLRGFFVRLRTPTIAQLVKPKKFSFIWALLWLLLFGIGIIIYLIYYAAKRDEDIPEGRRVWQRHGNAPTSLSLRTSHPTAWSSGSRKLNFCFPGFSEVRNI